MFEPAVINSPILTIARPQPDEYAAYYGKYIALVQGQDVLGELDRQRRDTMKLLCGKDEAEGEFRY
jgi:hypothetical protein